MFDPISKTWHFNSATLWIDFALSLIVIVGLLVVVINAAKRTVFTIASIASAVVSIFAWFFGLTFLWQLSLMFMTAFLAAVVIMNQSELKEFFGSLFRKKMSKGAQKVYDRHAICQKVALAVETLSKNKVGALITFEKNTLLSFSDYSSFRNLSPWGNKGAAPRKISAHGNPQD